MTKLLLTGILLATFVFANEPPVLQPKCAMPTFAAEFDQSTAVFIGEVVKDEKKGDNRFFEFEVKRFWKGVSSRIVSVSVSESMRYQAFYEEGKTYLVFAKADDDGHLFDGRCSRSAEVDGSSSTLKADLEKLGEAKTCIDLEGKEKNEEQ